MKSNTFGTSKSVTGGVLAALLAAAGVAGARQQAASPPPPEQVDYFKAIQISKAGAGIVLNLDLPRSFLERPAGRALRYSLRGKFRHVKPDAAPKTAAPGEALPAWVTVRESAVAPATVEGWAEWRPTVPLTRGFMAPLFNLGEAYAADRTLSAPVGERAKAYTEGQAFVAERLARDGLIATTMNVMLRVKRPWLAGESLNLGELKWCGIPVDLLDCFTIEGQPATAHIASWIQKGAPPDGITTGSRGAVFSYRPTCPGFELPVADGTEDPGLIRLQFSADAAFREPGDGGQIDVARQLAANLAQTPMLMSAEQRSLQKIKDALGAAFKGVSRSTPVVLAGTPMLMSPWAQDNAVAGRVSAASANTAVTIVPRFASINEQSSQFVPGDSLVFESLRSADSLVGQIYQSRLLFQGGNIIAIPDPTNGQRMLLVGEAEIYRIRALGLSGDQAAAALGVEFGAGRVHILPAVSFHIDMELTVRKVGDSLVACINDEKAASLLIFRAGADAMAKAGMIRPDHHARIVKAAEAGEGEELAVAVSLVWDAIVANLDADGFIGEKIKGALGASETGRGAGTVERLLLAMDQIDSYNLADDKLVTRNTEDWFKRYIVSLRQRTAERAEFVKHLEKIGLKVVRVPSTSEDNLSTNTINGIQTKSAYFMPAFGGIYAPLDEAAAKQIGAAFGGVKVVPISCGAVQEKYGGLHCMTGIYPAGK